MIPIIIPAYEPDARLLELLETLKALRAAEADATSWGLTLYGALVAAVVGYFSLALLVGTLKGSKFWLFGVYCLAAGLLTLILV